jgi:ribosomal protein L37AE/L43A
MAEVADESPAFACPHCHAGVHVEGPAEAFVRCPHCGEEFALPAEATSPELPIQSTQTDQLDGQRIRQIVVQRTADIRLRSYFLLTAFGCLGAATTFLYRIGQRLFYRWPWNWVGALHIVISIAAIFGGGYLLTRAHRLTRELNKPLLPEPTMPPDFSNLGDGSQQARALEEL